MLAILHVAPKLQRTSEILFKSAILSRFMRLEYPYIGIRQNFSH